MTAIRAHFDGKVFVPDEPVDMPAGTAASVVVPLVVQPPKSPAEKSPAEKPRKPLAELAAILDALPDNSNLPPDYASQVDHYLYGTPKRG